MLGALAAQTQGGICLWGVHRCTSAARDIQVPGLSGAPLDLCSDAPKHQANPDWDGPRGPWGRHRAVGQPLTSLTSSVTLLTPLQPLLPPAAPQKMLFSD